MVKISEGIERFSIVTLLMNHCTSEVPDFLMSFTLCSNQFYLHYHYHLYFSPALINNVTDCFRSLYHHHQYHYHHG